VVPRNLSPIPVSCFPGACIADHTAPDRVAAAVAGLTQSQDFGFIGDSGIASIFRGCCWWIDRSRKSQFPCGLDAVRRMTAPKPGPADVAMHRLLPDSLTLASYLHSAAP
jgi:hypothetical protein